MSRETNNSFFEKIAQQYSSDVAALFSYFGITANVTGRNIKNAIRAFKYPFSSKLSVIIDKGKNHSNFEGFDGKIGELFNAVKDTLANNAKKEEERKKEEAKILGMPPALFTGVLLIVALIVTLIIIKIVKRK